MFEGQCEGEKITLGNVSLNDLILDEGNPRLSTPEGQGRLERSLAHYGFVNPVICYRVAAEDMPYAQEQRINASPGQLFVSAGHQRIKAAREKGFETIPVIIYPFRSLKEARAYNVADNKLAEMSDWDFPKLKDRLEDLDDGSFDLEQTGFSKDELGGIMSWTHGETGGEGGAGEGREIKCPKCGYSWVPDKT